MRIDTRFRIVTVSFVRAPCSFVHEHVEDESVLIQVESLQIVVKIGTRKQTFWYKVIFYAFILEVQIDLPNRFEIPQAETAHFIRLSRAIESDNEGPIEPIMTK